MSESLYSPSWYRVADLKPRLRSHCQLHRHSYRGELWYVLQNPVTGRFHRFSPAAYLIIGMFDGQYTVQEIWEQAAQKLGDDVPTQQEVINLLTQLFRADVLQTDVVPMIEEMQQRQQQGERQKRMQHLRSPLSIRIPLFDPDKLLDALLPLTRWCFSKASAVLWLLLMVAGIVLAGRHWSALTDNIVDQALAMENLMVLWFVFPLVKAMHELGHGLAVKRWGGEVHEMGIMLLVFMPVPYVDATASSAFQEKHRRIVVAAAGMAVELFLAVLALLVWINVEPGMVRAIAYNVMLVAGVSTIFFNGNPLLRFDAYYMLADAVEIPNLGGRANQYLGYLFQRYLFRAEGAHSPVLADGEAGWFVFYSIASFCYRMTVMFGIVMLVASHYFVVGFILALWSIHSMLLQPAWRSLKFLFTAPVLEAVRQRAVSTVIAGCGVIVAFVLLVPVAASVRVEGVVWAPEQTLVRPLVSGHITEVVAAPNSVVEKGDVLLRVNDPQLLADVLIYKAQLKSLQARYSDELVNDRTRAQVTREEIAAIEPQLQRAEERAAALDVRSPKNGIFTVEQVEDLPGRFVSRGEILAYVLEFNDATARVVVNQDQADLVRISNQGVEVHFSSAFNDIINGQIRRQVPAATDELPSPVLSTDGGGRHAVVPGDDGSLKTIQKLFQFDVSLESKLPVQRLGERVYIKFLRDPEPLGLQAYRALRQLFLSQLDV